MPSDPGATVGDGGADDDVAIGAVGGAGAGRSSDPQADAVMDTMAAKAQMVWRVFIDGSSLCVRLIGAASDAGRPTPR